MTAVGRGARAAAAPPTPGHDAPPGRGRRRREVAAVACVVAVAALLAVVRAGDGGPRVVARDAGGYVVASLALPGDGRFALAYRHSVYRAPALERFRAAPGGGLRLEAVSSPSEAVLDYYALDGRRARRDGWWTLRLAHPVRFQTLPLIATSVGRRTLVAGGTRIPLYAAGGRARHLRIGLDGVR